MVLAVLIAMLFDGECVGPNDPDANICSFCLWCGDVNGDTCVDVLDLILVLNAWGAVEAGHPADFDLDGLVGVGDLVEVLLSYNCQCPCE